MRAHRGYRSKTPPRQSLRMGEGIAGRAALERRVEHADNIADPDSGFARYELVAGEDFVTCYCAPLVSKGNVLGVLNILQRAPRLHPDEEWLTFLEAMAGQAAIAIDSAMLFNNLTRSNTELVLAYDATIEGWSHAMDLRDKETEGHTQRVTNLMVQLARAMGMDEEQIIHARRGALLHDMGKLGVPDKILLKPGALTDEEWLVMRQHPTFAHEMLFPIHYLRAALDIPYCHHEKWDGTGYPRGLKGEQIPLAARMFAVIDVYDALTSERPYRAAWSKEKTLEHIRGLAGTHFDPTVVQAFLQLLDESALASQE